MTYEQIKTLIKSAPEPSSYRFFREGGVPLPPYIVWYFENTTNFAADDQVYTVIDTLIIERYSAYKDFEGESALEALLNAANLVWDRSESYLNTEHLFVTTYEMEVVING